MNNMRKYVKIAIDGHSSCGKSTLAKDIAHEFNYLYIDSGAMYRAVALYFLENNIDVTNIKQVENALEEIDIEMSSQQELFSIRLNGAEITERIIAIDVSNIVSDVAAITSLRKKLVRIQQLIGQSQDVVMDGRDIGTVVYPDAEVKFFITADHDIRTQRRYEELKRKKMPTLLEEVSRNLKTRDRIDSTRSDSPLKQADDAVLINNSFMDREEQLFIAMKIIEQKIKIK